MMLVKNLLTMIFSNPESIIWFSLLVLFIIIFFIYHKRKLKQAASHLSNRLQDAEAEKSTLEAEKKKKEETSRKIWDMSEAVYREKRKVDQQIEQLRIETDKLEQEKKKFKEKNIKLWEQSIAIHKEKTKIALLHKEITDSIRYAERIQNAILPPDEQVAELLPNSFVLFKPKDIVSGDFYWLAPLRGGAAVLFAACDCTGHGVPGAFMSMIGNTLINEAVVDKGISQPNEILHDVRKGIIKSLKQTEKGQKDGMDAAFCCLISSPTSEATVRSNDRGNPTHKYTLQYAGANNPLFIIRKGAKSSEIYKEALPFKEGLGGAVIKPDKQPIGYLTAEQKPFTHHEIQLQTGDTIYIFSDGYVDQFGGPQNKKFMIKRFRELLLSIQEKSMNEQKEILDKNIEDWRGNKDQVDDILVIGVRI